MSDRIHGEGIFRCQGCGHIYPEYVNGCVKHDDGERKVILVISDALTEESKTERILGGGEGWGEPFIKGENDE